jgi:membrane protease YdiL (CAAX protease family)
VTAGRVRAAVSIYAILAAVAWIGCALAGRRAWTLATPLGGSRWVSLPVALVSGLACGWIVVVSTRWISTRFGWGRALTAELRAGLAGLDRRAIPWLAASSALGEELLFRGAIQSSLIDHGGTAQGFILASSLFGLMHIPANRRLVPWTLMALAMGAVFGALFLWTGELVAPVVAHAVINLVNLRFILDSAPGERDPRAANTADDYRSRPA